MTRFPLEATSWRLVIRRVTRHIALSKAQPAVVPIPPFSDWLGVIASHRFAPLTSKRAISRVFIDPIRENTTKPQVAVLRNQLGSHLNNVFHHQRAYQFSLYMEILCLERVRLNDTETRRAPYPSAGATAYGSLPLVPFASETSQRHNILNEMNQRKFGHNPSNSKCKASQEFADFLYYFKPSCVL